MHLSGRVANEAALVALDAHAAIDARGAIAPDGTRHVWAELLATESPHRVVLAWHPGTAAPPASQLSARFDADGDGSTLRLTQSGWERYGDAGAEHRRSYHRGWEDVLDCLVEAAKARAG